MVCYSLINIKIYKKGQGFICLGEVLVSYQIIKSVKPHYSCSHQLSLSISCDPVRPSLSPHNHHEHLQQVCHCIPPARPTGGWTHVPLLDFVGHLVLIP